MIAWSVACPQSRSQPLCRLSQPNTGADMAQSMSVADAAYNVVHDYPGGAAALQVRMGGKTNLSAEVNPNIRTAKMPDRIAAMNAPA